MTRRQGAVATVLAVALIGALLGACGQGQGRLGTLPAKATTSATPSPTAPSPAASPSKSPLPHGFVDISDVDPTILQDIRYYTEHNFMGRRITGYEAPRCLLTMQAAQALRKAQQAAIAKNLRLKVYDCYRPKPAADSFKRWVTEDPDDQKMKKEFYPSLTKSQLLSAGWISGGISGHSRGSTVDLTIVAYPPATQPPYVPGEPLVECTKPAAERFPDNSVDMGTGYDCFDKASYTAASGISKQAKQNRGILDQLMTGAGFKNYEKEWWHYRLLNEPHPNDHFDFPIVP